MGLLLMSRPRAGCLCHDIQTRSPGWQINRRAGACRFRQAQCEGRARLLSYPRRVQVSPLCPSQNKSGTGSRIFLGEGNKKTEIRSHTRILPCCCYSGFFPPRGTFFGPTICFSPNTLTSGDRYSSHLMVSNEKINQSDCFVPRLSPLREFILPIRQAPRRHHDPAGRSPGQWILSTMPTMAASTGISSP